MDHLEQFGLSQDPFNNDPQQRFHFASSEYRDAERRALRGALSGKGLCVVVGDVGCGKSTVARSLFHDLDERRFDTSLMVLARVGDDPTWLLGQIARQLGVSRASDERVSLLSQIYDRLVSIHEHGRRAVVILDDAHLLAGRQTLSDVRAMLNFEHDEARLLTLFLVGLPVLERVLALDPALAQRVEVRVALRPLGPESAAAYLGHRLRQAGGQDTVLEPAAVGALHERAGGVPRRLNVLADNALFEAYLAGRRSVSAADVERAATELSSGEPAATEVVPAVVVTAPRAAEALPATDPLASAELGEVAPAMAFDEEAGADRADEDDLLQIDAGLGIDLGAEDDLLDESELGDDTFGDPGDDELVLKDPELEFASEPPTGPGDDFFSR